MRHKGTLIDWKDDRGFGFIEPADEGTRIFCHVKAFEVRVRRPIAGDRVTYEVSYSPDGRLSATRIRPLGLEEANYQSNVRKKPKGERTPTRHTQSKPLQWSIAWTCSCVAFSFAGIVALMAVGRVPILTIVIYVAVSGVTMLAYMFDKSAAMNGRQRIPEQTLHFMELLGGWPGAWIAQKIFRHKSRKLSFRILFWLCALCNVAALLFYSFPEWR